LLCTDRLSQRKLTEDSPVVRQHNVCYVKTVDREVIMDPVLGVTTAMSWLIHELFQTTVVQQ